MEQYLVEIRVLERLFMTVVIFGVGLIFIVVFARRGHEMTLLITEGKGILGNIVATISLPVLLLAILVAYAWVSLSNPVTIQDTATKIAAISPPEDTPVTTSGNSYIGLGGTETVALIENYYQDLFRAFQEAGENRERLSVSDSKFLVGLAARLSMLRARGEFEPDLFVSGFSFAEIQRRIEAASDAR
ncbi:hypothetical protein AIOL_001814 [Candidatus Rhodobacter oscarellae]|uniref:Uncharacterized protein n=1 Tax=Candidatus Rhodobacter oscarellae TaxID=1675527 RepID=A0A0J9E2E2_9RHOB|nr:hypothetical protein [Candidatus Rhodobacter lobularis]KMW56857.1 hypothetical protein AIOL_001814 [Candidatus Rhodobacter lobularis]